MVGNFLSASGVNRSVCEDLADRLSQHGLSVLTTSSYPGRIRKLVDMLSQIVSQRRRYEVAHLDVYSGAAFRWAELSCGVLRRLGKPIALSLHGGNLPSFSKQNEGRIRRMFSHAQAITAPSGYLARELSEYGDIQIVPNPIELSLYDYRHRSHVAPKLIWLRAFCEIYNPTLAPRVIQLLVDEFPNLTLQMIGPDKDGSRKHTESLAAKLGVSSHIRFEGGIPKQSVPSRLNSSDIFLNTTDFDNTPVSVMEAMACGLCTVSTNVGGLPDLVSHRVNGLLTPPRSANALASEIRSLLTQPELPGLISRNARSKIEQMDWSQVIPKWKNLFSELVGR